jgi:hypothetical protein
MHTDSTLEVFNDAMTTMGAKFREFSKKTCSAFATRELKREANARLRRQLKAQGRRNSTNQSAPVVSSVEHIGRLEKKFNLQTYKFHSLGDYIANIRRYGTTDSYSTERVSDIIIRQVQPCLLTCLVL